MRSLAVFLVVGLLACEGASASMRPTQAPPVPEKYLDIVSSVFFVELRAGSYLGRFLTTEELAALFGEEYPAPNGETLRLSCDGKPGSLCVLLDARGRLQDIRVITPDGTHTLWSSNFPAGRAGPGLEPTGRDAEALEGEEEAFRRTLLGTILYASSLACSYLAPPSRIFYAPTGEWLARQGLDFPPYISGSGEGTSYEVVLRDASLQPRYVIRAWKGSGATVCSRSVRRVLPDGRLVPLIAPNGAGFSVASSATCDFELSSNDCANCILCGWCSGRTCEICGRQQCCDYTAADRCEGNCCYVDIDCPGDDNDRTMRSCCGP